MRPQQRHVTVAGGHRIGWLETGAGPPVVLVHGLGTSGAWWSPSIPGLARHHRLLVVDLVGFGASRGQPFRLEAAAGQLGAWADEIGLERAAFVGHSMGGLVVADLAARRPELVERLVLVDSAGLALPQRVSGHLRNVLHGGRFLPLRAFPVAVLCALQCGPLTIARAAHQVLATDLGDRLGSITAPTLVVWGARDRLLPPDFGRRVAAAIPGSRFVSIEDAGHSPMWEQPAGFQRTVAAFLGEAATMQAGPPASTEPPNPASEAEPAAAAGATELAVPAPETGNFAAILPTSGRVVSRYLQVGTWEVHARVGRPDHGVDTPPIVLVHGYMISSRYYARVLRRLAGRHLVFAPDLPGFGWSSKPDRILDVRELGDALIATMEAAGIGRAILVGNSLGAQVVAQATADHPDHVLATVLTGPTFDPAEPSLAGHAWRVVGDIPHEPPSIWFEQLRDWVLAGLPRAVGTLRHAWAHRIESVLPEVRVPTVVVRGEHDSLAPRRWVREAADLVPNGRALEVRGAGHAVDYGAPKAIARIIEEIADSLAAAGRPQGGGTMPMQIVSATHRRRPAARPRRVRAGPRRG